MPLRLDNANALPTYPQQRQKQQEAACGADHVADGGRSGRQFLRRRHFALAARQRDKALRDHRDHSCIARRQQATCSVRQTETLPPSPRRGALLPGRGRLPGACRMGFGPALMEKARAGDDPGIDCRSAGGRGGAMRAINAARESVSGSRRTPSRGKSIIGPASARLGVGPSPSQSARSSGSGLRLR